MIALYLALGSFGSLFTFWLLWIIVSGLSRARDEGRLSRLVIGIGKFMGILGLVVDVLCNVLICTCLFLDVPREPTLSQRLRRLVLASGWRQRFGVWVAVSLINPFSVDPASPHIHIPPIAAA